MTLCVISDEITFSFDICCVSHIKCIEGSQMACYPPQLLRAMLLFASGCFRYLPNIPCGISGFLKHNFGFDSFRIISIHFDLTPDFSRLLQGSWSNFGQTSQSPTMHRVRSSGGHRGSTSTMVYWDVLSEHDVNSMWTPTMSPCIASLLVSGIILYMRVESCTHQQDVFHIEQSAVLISFSKI